MFISGRFGLKSFDITNPLAAEAARLARRRGQRPVRRGGEPGQRVAGAAQGDVRRHVGERGHGRRPAPEARLPLARPARVRREHRQPGLPSRASTSSTSRTRSSSRSSASRRRRRATRRPASTSAGGSGRAGPRRTRTSRRWAGPAGRSSSPTCATPKQPKVNPNPIDLDRNDGTIDYSHDVQVDDAGIAWVSGRGGTRGYWTDGLALRPDARRQAHATPENPVPYAGGGFEETVFPTRTSSRFMHNAWRPLGDDARTRATATSSTRPRRSSPAGRSRTAAPTTARSSSPARGSYNGEAWRSTPTHKFRLKTVATWHPFGKEGSSTSTDCSAHYFQIQDRILSMSFYSQGSRFLDITIRPLRPRSPLQARHGLLATYPHRGLYYSADRNGVSSCA